MWQLRQQATAQKNGGNGCHKNKQKTQHNHCKKCLYATFQTHIKSRKCRKADKKKGGGHRITSSAVTTTTVQPRLLPSVTDLPVDMLLLISEYLDTRSLVYLSLITKTMNSILEKPVQLRIINEFESNTDNFIVFDLSHYYWRAILKVAYYEEKTHKWLEDLLVTKVDNIVWKEKFIFTLFKIMNHIESIGDRVVFDKSLSKLKEIAYQCISILQTLVEASKLQQPILDTTFYIVDRFDDIRLQRVNNDNPSPVIQVIKQIDRLSDI
jgi:hypothetical protein